MKVLVVSGFLGAGKTTFIKELIRKSGLKPVVLENEYGDNEIDKKDISKADDLEILEFMEGCVCCTKKDTFLNTVLAISAGLDPEYLVVEPTGVGKLGNILENINAVTYDRIKLLPPVVVLTPRSFDDNLNEYPEIYRNQIENAGKIVFSKIENEPKEYINSIAAKIKSINPGLDVRSSVAACSEGNIDRGGDQKLANAGSQYILTERYQECGSDWFRELLSGDSEPIRAVVTDRTEDNIDELSVRGGEFDSPYNAMVFLEDILHGKFGDIVRAKGIIKIAGDKVRFDVADGLYQFSPEEDSKALRQSVFIGHDIRSDEIFGRLGIDKPEELLRNKFLLGKKKSGDRSVTDSVE